MTDSLRHCRITSCKIPLRVRYSEVDRQNAVHHSRYAEYFEMGRTELLRINGYDYRTLEDQDLLLAVARLEIRFKAPARYDDQLELTTRLGQTDRVRLEHLYELTRPDDNRLLSRGRSLLVHIDSQGHLQPLPTFLLPTDH